jgi:hypothetical protein
MPTNHNFVLFTDAREEPPSSEPPSSAPPRRSSRRHVGRTRVSTTRPAASVPPTEAYRFSNEFLEELKAIQNRRFTFVRATLVAQITIRDLFVHANAGQHVPEDADLFFEGVY